jgi:hypothetical protein
MKEKIRQVVNDSIVGLLLTSLVILCLFLFASIYLIKTLIKFTTKNIQHIKEKKIKKKILITHIKEIEK